MRSTALFFLALTFSAGACAPQPGPSTPAPATPAPVTATPAGAAPATSTKTGAPFDPALADKLVPGQSTLAEAEALLGPPSRIRAYAGGQSMARWSYTRLRESAALDIIFGRDNKMASIVRRQ
jgi:hypothetical protein